jgi:hypothetical protein
VSREPSINNFGLLIAYILPGFTVLWAVRAAIPIDSWLGQGPTDAPTVGGFLYVTLASILAGLTVSTVRWLLIDALHHRTGLPPPPRDFAQLRGNETAFGLIVDDHYRYYQFYANMLVALAIVLVVRHAAVGASWTRFNDTDASILIAAPVFFAGSRDTLRKYYDRTGQLLGKRGRQASTHQAGHGHTEGGGELIDVDE